LQAFISDNYSFIDKNNDKMLLHKKIWSIFAPY